MKKTMSIILSIVLCFSLTSFAFAKENNGQDDALVFTINEEEQYQLLKAKTNEELSAEGFSTDEIEEIRNFDYFTALSERADLPDETLLLYGYTPHEIDELRQYVSAGPKSRKTISSTTMTLKLEPINKVARKKVTFRLSWNWSRVPFLKFVDCIGASWITSNGSGTFYYDPQSNNKVHLKYTKINPDAHGSSTDSSIEWPNSMVTNSQVASKFAISIGEDFFAFSGYGDFTLECTSGSVDKFYIDSGYGHSIVSISPGISVSVSGKSVSIGFKGGADEKHCKRVYNANNYTIVKNFDT